MKTTEKTFIQGKKDEKKISIQNDSNGSRFYISATWRIR